MSVKLFVRPARLPEERERLTELLGRNLPAFDHALRFDWVYQTGPAGPARAWFVCAGTSDRVIGTASLFPKLVWIDGRLAKCGQVGDFAVDSAHRSLGPALMLQKATLGPVRDGELAFCYDCPPHDRGMATFDRLGMAPVCRMERRARLLDARDVVEKRVRGGSLVRRPVTAAVNGLLALGTASYRPPQDVAVELHDGLFDGSFTTLDEEIARTESGTVRARRGADDLNWRFRRDPANEYRVLTARRNGVLQGFVVFQRRERRARIADVLARRDEIHAALLHAAAAAARREGAWTIDLLVVRGTSESALAHRARFFHRGDAERVVVYGGESGQRWEGTRWRLNASDIMA